jgi:hypothetical protein
VAFRCLAPAERREGGDEVVVQPKRSVADEDLN